MSTNTMLPAGTSVGLEEAALKMRELATVSASLMVKLIGPLGVSSSVV